LLRAVCTAFVALTAAYAQTGDALLERLEGKRRQEQAVYDFAGVLDARTRDDVESVLDDLRNKTDVPVIVVTLRSLEGGDLADVANRLYERWGIGRKGKDEGALLVVALEERRARIEVGYGMEGILPDAKCGRILDEHLVPNFKAGRYGEGIRSGAYAVASVVAADRGVRLGRAPVRRQRERGSSWLSLLFLIILIPLVIRHPWLLFFLLNSGRGGGYSGGGFGGGGFGGFGGGLSGGGGAGRGW